MKKLNNEKIKSKVIQGSKWILGFRFLDRIFHVVRSIVLARLLSPDELGTFYISFTIFVAVDMFTKRGFDSSIIYHNQINRIFLETTWTVRLINCLIFGILTITLASCIGNFFNEPNSISLIRAIGFTIIIIGFTNVSILLFTRELNFKMIGFIEMLSSAVEMIVAILLVIILNSVWALIFGLMLGKIFKVILSFYFEPRIIAFKINYKYLQSILNYGGWIASTGIIVIVVNTIDNVVVAKYLESEQLGYYNIALLIACTSIIEITNILTKIAFPTYSRIKGNTKSLIKVYKQSVEVISLISIPLVLLIINYSEEIIILVLGDNWLPMNNLIKILALVGIMRGFHAIGAPLFQGTGNSKIAFYNNLIRLLILLIIIIPLTKIYGTEGTALALLISNIFAFIMWVKACNKILGINKYILFYVRLLLPLVISNIILLFLILTTNIIYNINNILLLIVTILIISILYMIVVYIVNKFIRIEFVTVLISNINKKVAYE